MSLLNSVVATMQNRRQFKRLASMALGAGISVVLVGYLAFQVSWTEFITIAGRVPALSLLGAFALYLFLNFCRALRFRTLLDKKELPLKVLFPIALYHNFLLRTLPLMAGEISYIALLRQYLGQRVSEGVSSLLEARLFELLLVIMGGMVGVLAVGGRLTDRPQMLAALLLVCGLAGGVGMYLLGPLSRAFLKGWHWVAEAGPWRRLAVLGRVEQKLWEIPGQLDRVRRRRLFLETMALSFCSYGASLGFNLLLLKATGVDQSTGVLLAIISIVMVASWFPLSVSGFGVIEGSWTFGLVVLAGLDAGQSVTIGFFLHGCQVLAVVLSGVIGYVLLARLARTPPGGQRV
jgi:uncharacterized membrane protein YbhN (UPF0104 family)